MVIVAIGAHPDDIEFGCYGTLARLSKSHEIRFLIFTAGELIASKEGRVKEAEQSANIIGAKVEFLDFRDGFIPVNGRSVEKLSEKIKMYKPDMVFTLYPHDTHQDHRAVSEITLSSVRFTPMILFYEVPQTEKMFSPNYYMDITDFFGTKKKALECFASQAHRPYLDINEIRGLAQYRAYNVFHPKRLFEAFVLYRELHS